MKWITSLFSAKTTRLGTRTWFIFMTAFLLYLLLSNIIEYRSEKIEFAVTETRHGSEFAYPDSLRPGINSYKNAVVFGNPTIKIENPGILLTFLVPSTNLMRDPFYNALFLLIVIILMCDTWWLDFNKPFTGKLGKALLWIAIACWGGWVLNYARAIWVDSQIMKITNNQYSAPRFFWNSIEIWIGAICFRFSLFVRSAESLQKEQDLTV